MRQCEKRQLPCPILICATSSLANRRQVDLDNQSVNLNAQHQDSLFRGETKEESYIKSMVFEAFYPPNSISLCSVYMQNVLYFFVGSSESALLGNRREVNRCKYPFQVRFLFNAVMRQFRWSLKNEIPRGIRCCKTSVYICSTSNNDSIYYDNDDKIKCIATC